MIKELNNKNFFETVETCEKPVFLDFWASWCPPCRMMDPVIEALEKHYEDKLFIGKLNTDLYSKVSDKLKVSGIPTYMIYIDGKEVWRKTGAIAKKKLIIEIDKYIKE